MSQTPQGAPEEQLRQQVKTLAEKFLRRTAGQVGTFRESLTKLSQGDGTALQPINEVAHKIHGSGAVFGFPQISECAEHLERLSGGMLKALDTVAASQHTEHVQQLTTHVEELEKAVASELSLLGNQ